MNDNPPISAELPILDFLVTETAPSIELATVVPTNQQTSETQTEVSGQSNQITSQETSNFQSQQNSESVSQSNQESLVQDSEKAPSNTVLEGEQKLPEAQNIPDIIASLEKEETQEAFELATVSSLGPVPEGFLEYGPPGFVEYGPPKGDEVCMTFWLNDHLYEYEPTANEPRPKSTPFFKISSITP